jgi:hypothetical protein
MEAIDNVSSTKERASGIDLTRGRLILG